MRGASPEEIRRGEPERGPGVRGGMAWPRGRRAELGPERALQALSDWTDTAQ